MKSVLSLENLPKICSQLNSKTLSYKFLKQIYIWRFKVLENFDSGKYFR